ncbi:ABC transporter substrate-binding protein [uncultured Tessaracoccus sp.]|uniref:ABC transporter substrate-binding protein n=1 Tax=uncultured Tessaracoccus sp. TaxID=905023 RepID=UPI0025E4392D|nr:extracellular solute-binding protein [uncultured Tessaracoccus sp.]
MRRRTFISAGFAVSASVALAACAPGSGSSGDGGASTDPTDIVTDPAKFGDITLVVWDQEVRGSQNDALEALNKAFQEQYPNITIDRKSQAFDDLKKQTSLALSGNDVPDVLQVNNARGDMGEFVAAGQLLNLSPYAKAYGWEDRYSDSVLAKVRYSPDAKTFGEGDLYGLPQTGEIVGIFFSQKKLDALGIQVPKTWDEYLAALDKAKAAGEQPLVLGNIQKWPALHVFGPLQANYVDADTITTLGMGNAGATWVDDANKAAMTQFATWGTKGYFGSSPNGTDYEPAWADFAKGKGVFLPAGSWLGTDLEKTMGADIRFMAPPPGLDGQHATTGGTGIPFSIPAKAKHADAAAAYIDFITTDDAMKTIADNGGMPVNKTADLAPDKGVQHDIFTEFDRISTDGTLLPYLDYATPSFADTAGQGLQEALSGQKSPEDVLQALENDYEKFAGE